MLKVAISTLGCKVNQYESEKLRQAFFDAGCEISDNSEDSVDVHIVNTCTVTALSDKKSRQMIRKAIRKNPQATIVATGCYVDAEPDKIFNIRGVDLIVANKEKSKLPRLILGTSIDSSKSTPLNQCHTRALIKIQDGCDQFCSFCQIPYVRGNPSSRSPSEIICEARKLAESGVKEIVLTGIHLGRYGADMSPSFDLVDLLSQLLPVPGLKRIRLSSIEVKEVDKRIMALFASSSKLCKHLHIPLQSGDDEILKKMNRNYSSEEYLTIVRNIRAKIPDLALTTDIMVGFPGESEDQFRRTLFVAGEAAFARTHVFNFSARPRTKAAAMEDKIPGIIKKDRVKRMMKVAEDLSREYRKRFIGVTVDVLVEGEKDNLLTGLTNNYMRVRFEAGSDIIGKIVPVKLLELKQDFILGKLWKRAEVKV